MGFGLNDINETQRSYHGLKQRTPIVLTLARFSAACVILMASAAGCR